MLDAIRRCDSECMTRERSNDSRQWHALLSRDRRADGSFVYGVTSTGVYCRPSCGARRPLRRNVVFLESAASAERAGFRPCKRCRPGETPVRSGPARAIAAACRLIETSAAPPSLAALATRAGLSPYHFHRTFKAMTGLTPRAYASSRRAARARDTLRRDTTVTDALFDAGFNSSARFYATARETLGMTPRSYRAGGAGTTITFAVATSSLGGVLVASSDLGVCAILMGDDPATLAADLRRRFPRATVVEGGATFASVVRDVLSLVDDPARGSDLPLDLRGTVFQCRVWDALRRVPAGTTISYADLARRIGAPGSARAVAGACAANPLAIAVPCHRVVRGDGGLSGYRWGVERKRILIERERELTAAGRATEKKRA